MRNYRLCIALLIVNLLSAQETDTIVLNFKEYLGYVKKYHPVAKQAELQLASGQANLMKARGGFDPKIEIDYARKVFKNTEYYDLFDATFKIPTWYGVEFKAGFEQNDGDFLNPQGSVPEDGLFSAGVSVPIAQGLLINDRMAILRKAKFFREQVKEDRNLAINKILTEASLAYFDWLKTYNEKEIYARFLENAKIRFEGIRKNALSGEIATIDTVEAKIALQNRTLSLEQAAIKFTKSSLLLSNFLWISDNIPIELQSNVIPEIDTENTINISLEILGRPLSDFLMEDHPKLRALDFKRKGLEVDQKLKANKLLPNIALQYNFLTEKPEFANSLNTAAYKGGITFQFPLFLRKERGDLQIAKYKVQDTQYELELNELQIRNKVTAIYQELASLEEQNRLIADIVADTNTLLLSEERKFSFGESSLFLINSREKSLISSKLKQNTLENNYFNAKARLFNSLAINPENL